VVVGCIPTPAAVKVDWLGCRIMLIGVVDLGGVMALGSMLWACGEPVGAGELLRSNAPGAGPETAVSEPEA